MPSGSHRRRQCAYKEGGQRCRRDGDGDPPLCAPHKYIVAEEAKRAERNATPGRAIRSVFEDFILGRPISGDKVASAINEAAWAMGGHLGIGADFFNEPDPDHYDQGVGGGHFPHQRENERRAPRDREYGVMDEERAKQAAVRAAKVELGFAESEPVTLEQIKTRHRELARKYHPDRPGGSVTKMQRVNAAVDVLEKAL